MPLQKQIEELPGLEDQARREAMRRAEELSGKCSHITVIASSEQLMRSPVSSKDKSLF